MAAGKKPRILVVEDDPSVLTTYRMLLERQGYEVVSVSSYNEAEGSLQKQNFDLLICDLSLEKQHSAFEVIDVARSHDREMAAVVVTGYASPEEMERAQENQVRVLLKPIEIEEFLSTISNALPKAYANNEKAKLKNA
jgi:DNA-binding NtrC family response regulator